ncbi:Hemerythrin-like domain-containing protein [Desulfonatronum thiosulfatophilum]|uniref:Hemerythrin-like domain-containing protein n=1 Tax=Desulfonatronum thiosulfatophilum TaxID=617002 RepID=A0A1G6E4C4_9BACT|nr:hemerythrin domain-containing protein [Desulfonatronum thiosulfatophilum]SDB52299.1 Hemerythrin-like domain-containing protein [Desulfonatronum thiosulfatophilum]
MQARGQLMKEHRVIERMISLIEETAGYIRKGNRIDPELVDIAVDFIRTYADRTHHGKEEDILFKKLDEKGLSTEDRRMMDELIADHVYARKVVQKIEQANARYRNGDESALDRIEENLRALVDLYPEHIEKEDKVFFPASRNYFTDREEEALLEEFMEFDRLMIHEKYDSVVESYAKKASSG